jgi:hypothetical protein
MLPGLPFAKIAGFVRFVFCYEQNEDEGEYGALV